MFSQVLSDSVRFGQVLTDSLGFCQIWSDSDRTSDSE